MAISIVLQILIAWIYGHFLEYFLHIMMHDYKRFPYLFQHHFGGHHKISRNNKMRDPSYEDILDRSSLFEIGSIAIGLLLHLPIAFFFPYSYATLVIGLCIYYIVHRKSHIDIAWAKKYLPWHYDHHMNSNQHANWGVRLPFVDWIFGTRVERTISRKEIIKKIIEMNKIKCSMRSSELYSNSDLTTEKKCDKKNST